MRFVVWSSAVVIGFFMGYAAIETSQLFESADSRYRILDAHAHELAGVVYDDNSVLEPFSSETEGWETQLFDQVDEERREAAKVILSFTSDSVEFYNEEGEQVTFQLNPAVAGKRVGDLSPNTPIFRLVSGSWSENIVPVEYVLTPRTTKEYMEERLEKWKRWTPFSL